jgi:flagellar hook assembly protein FlgD
MGMGISFYLDETSRVRLNLYNVKGQLVYRLADESMQQGTHSLRWNGKDMRGRTVSRGIYYLEMQKGAARTVSKIVYTK